MEFKIQHRHFFFISPVLGVCVCLGGRWRWGMDEVDVGFLILLLSFYLLIYFGGSSSH